MNEASRARAAPLKRPSKLLKILLMIAVVATSFPHVPQLTPTVQAAAPQVSPNPCFNESGRYDNSKSECPYFINEDNPEGFIYDPIDGNEDPDGADLFEIDDSYLELPPDAEIYYAEKAYQVRITDLNGNNYGQVLGTMLYLRSIDYAKYPNVGRSFAHKDTYTDWALVFNGNPDYVKEQKESDLHRLSNGRTYKRLSVRRLAEASGGKAEFITDKNWPNGGYVAVKVTSYPVIHSFVPTNPNSPPQAGSSYTMRATASEYNMRDDNVRWELYYNGTKVKEGTTNSGGDGRQFTFDVTFTVQSGNQHQLVLVVWDGVERANAITTDLQGGSGGEPPPGDGGGTPSGSCKVTINKPTGGQTRQKAEMDPDAEAEIQADDVFDVVRGIPTSEDINVTVWALEYLFQHTFRQMSGTITYDCEIEVEYELVWEEECGTKEKPKTCEESDTEYVTYNITIQRPYSYWQINNIEVYRIDRARVNNYALNDHIILYPKGYDPPSLDTWHSTDEKQHVKPAEAPTINYGPITVDGGDERPDPPDDTAKLRSMLENGIGQAQVRNDRVRFNSSTVMNDGWVTKDGPTPGNIPDPDVIDDDVLYKDGITISKTLQNKADTPIDGTIFYKLVSGSIGGSDKSFPIRGLNTVTVHTPTVTYPDTSDDEAHDQRTQVALNDELHAFGKELNVLVLDRPFTVEIPNEGQHRNIPGYGYRDYSKYIKKKQVRFPFDVWMDDRSTYVPKNTWIDFPTPKTEVVQFYMPIWVDEGPYTIWFRVIAENAPADADGQREANLDLKHHSSYSTVDVYVVGRLYDFRITGISDPVWKGVNRIYYTGNKKIDGANRGNPAPETLPIRAGSHPTYRNAVPKHGYHIKFDLKTKGNMFGLSDGIRITPQFYYVPKSGTTNSHATPVDLYYHNGRNKFIKVGSDRDIQRLYVTLAAPDRRVNPTDISNTANYYASIYPEYTSTTTKQTYVGKYTWQILPKQLRTLIGWKTQSDYSSQKESELLTPNLPTNPTQQQRARSLASVQQWYGQYTLPSQLYAVPAGTNIYNRSPLYEDSSIFLKNGYLLVNFKIETLRNGNASKPYLAYYGTPRNNQWRKEGFTHTVTDALGRSFTFHDGDVILFDLDYSSSGDYGSTITH